MARAKHFLRGLGTSYLVLATNTLWTLVSLPVALHYLPRAEYTLWLIVAQVSVYFAMIDLGTSGAGIRLLVDHKDARSGGEYGSLIRSMWLLGAGQGCLILLAGLAGTRFLPFFFDNIPREMTGSFERLWTWQVLFLSAHFALRVGNQILQAHQRIDLSNFAQMASLLVNLGALLLGFEAGLGLDSFILSQGLGALVLLALPLLFCWRLKLLPARGTWGRISRQYLRQVFDLGSEFFLIILGTTLTTGSQIFLLTRCLERSVALEAALVWSVMTKLFTLASQIVWRIIGMANPAFAEMFVRGEWDRLWRRYRSVLELTTLASGYLGLLIGLGNNAVVAVWTRTPIQWPAWNNWLLAVWLLLTTQACCHSSFLLYLKRARPLKIIYLAEGLIFVLVSTLIVPRFGITGLLVNSIFWTLLLTWQCGLREVAQAMNRPSHSLALDGFSPLARYLAVMLPLGAALAWLTRDSAWSRLLGCVLPVAVIGPAVMVRFCLSSEITQEMLRHLPAALRPAARTLAGLPPAA